MGWPDVGYPHHDTVVTATMWNARTALWATARREMAEEEQEGILNANDRLEVRMLLGDEERTF